MHTYFSSGLSVFRGHHHARPRLFRRIIWLALILLVSHVSANLQAQAVDSEAKPKLVIPQKPLGTDNATATTKPRYDCSGGLQVASEVGRAYIEQAIDDALNILKTCEPCHQMFDSEDPNYAIELLKRLRQDNAIIISEATPRRFLLSPDRQKLTVDEREELKTAGAVLDLLGSRTGEMKLPCLYLNPKAFIVTGRPAENYGLYGLDPRTQRAVAILHELGHIARVIQPDGGDPAGKSDKSVANTDCIRRNCISCEPLRLCPGMPERPKKRRRNRPQSATQP